MTNLSRRQVSAGLVGIAGGAALGGRMAAAQSYATADLHFICAFAAGSGADVIARWYAEKMRPMIGRNIIVENKVGALGNLATEYVARSKPDGHTVFVNVVTGLASSMSLFKNPPVDVVNALQVVSTVNKQGTMLVVRADAPWMTLADLTAHLRAKKEKASYGISTPSGRVMAALYNQKENLPAVEVSYRTISDAVNDLSSGNLDFAIYDSFFASSQSREKRIRILAVSTPERLGSYPDVPTMTESGVPMGMVAWFGLIVPKATPRPIVDQLSTMANTVTQLPETKTFFNGFGADPRASTPDEGQAFLREQIDEWKEWVRIAKIDPQ